jgi:hypothetical protein
MKSVLLFGRSPFINQINLPALLHHTTAGINHIAFEHGMDYGFFYDSEPPKPEGCKTKTIAPIWFSSASHPVNPVPASIPVLSKIHRDGGQVVGFELFTCTLAVNWLILQGFKQIYLIGIDHVEQPGPLQHHDGTFAVADCMVEAHQRVKAFIGRCQSGAKIYQCNPAVAADWPVPYQDLTELYATF